MYGVGSVWSAECMKWGSVGEGRVWRGKVYEVAGECIERGSVLKGEGME